MTEGRELADRYFSAIRSRDHDAVAAVFSPDAELITPTGTYVGPDEIAGFYRESAFAFDDLDPAPGPFLVDGDRLAVEIDLRMGGTTNRVADFFTFDDAGIRRLAVYLLPEPPS